MVWHHHMPSQVTQARRQEMVEAMAAAQYGVQPGLWTPCAASGRDTLVQDAGYHLAYLCTASAIGNPALFTD